MKKLTITIEDNIYRGLHAIIGRGNISRFLANLARPHVVPKELEEEYKKMAAEEAREEEAAEWSESLISDVQDEPR